MPVLPGDDEPSGSNAPGMKTPVRKTSSTETNYYSSLPRSMGHRALPSLPETEVPVSPPSGSGLPLQRSVSHNPAGSSGDVRGRSGSSTLRHNQSSTKSPLITDLIAAETQTRMNLADSDSNEIKRPDKLDLWYD